MRVKFTSVVAEGNVELCEVAVTDQLDVVVVFQEGDTTDGAVRNNTGIVTLLGAPSNFDCL